MRDPFPPPAFPRFPDPLVACTEPAGFFELCLGVACTAAQHIESVRRERKGCGKGCGYRHRSSVLLDLADFALRQIGLLLRTLARPGRRQSCRA